MAAMFPRRGGVLVVAPCSYHCGGGWPDARRVEDAMREDDERWMRKALALAEVSNGHTSPNPAVGSVVVRNGVCVGAGFHPRAGEPHAEVFALREAGEHASGATLYTTLEPCSHTGRTPPCADTIIQRGVARVVSALEDPDPRVSGRGHTRLTEAGIEVCVGVLAADASRAHGAYIKWKRTGLPFVTMKVAMSLDGKTATVAGESQWITSPAARTEGHRLRDRHDAIVVGVGTVLADDPSLTTRLPEGGRDAVRIVLDTHARTPLTAKVVTQTSDAGAVIVVGAAADSHRVGALRAAGADVWRLDGAVTILAVLERCGSGEMLSVLVEGGSRAHGSFVTARAVDRCVAFVAPKILGGATATPTVGGEGWARLADALALDDWEARACGPDVMLDGYAVQP